MLEKPLEPPRLPGVSYSPFKLPVQVLCSRTEVPFVVICTMLNMLNLSSQMSAKNTLLFLHVIYITHK